MLQLMRNSTRNIVIKVVLFGIVILGMASYAFIDMFTARVQGEKVASVGDIEVALTDYAGPMKPNYAVCNNWAFHGKWLRLSVWVGGLSNVSLPMPPLMPKPLINPFP